MKLKMQMQPAVTGQDRLDAASTLMGALLRARQHGWTPTTGPADHWFVASASNPGLARTVRLVTGMDGVVWTSCSCPSGFWRAGQAPTTCWHGAAVLEHLHTQGRVTVTAGLMTWKRKP